MSRAPISAEARPHVLASRVEGHRARERALLDAEGVRVALAFVALAVSVLLLAGGLLWRERARAAHAEPAAASLLLAAPGPSAPLGG